MKPIFFILLCITLLFHFGCSKNETKVETRFLEIQDFNAYQDPSTQTGEIQKASKAVVRIQTLRGTGTGFFISNDGLLMTNEHVLGGSNCVLSGCFITLDFDFQKSIPSDRSNSKRMFAKPIFADKHLDVTIFKIMYPDRRSFSPNHIVDFEQRTGKSLVNQSLTVVGHPLGGLKKAKKATVMDLRAGFLVLDEYMFGGNSGSPIFNSNGNVVGIIHRSGNDIGSISRDGLESQSIGTTSEKILKAISPGTLKVSDTEVNTDKIKAVFIDIDDENFNIAENPYLILAAQRLPKKNLQPTGTEGEYTSPIQSLMENQGNQCDRVIEEGLSTNYWDFNNNENSCLRNMFFISCKDKRGKLQFCPSNESQKKWIDRSEKVLEHRLKYFSELSTGALNVLYKMKKESTGGLSHQYWFKQYMSSAQPVLNFDLTSSIYGADLQNYYAEYDGQSLDRFIVNYKSYRFHHKELLQVLNTHLMRFGTLASSRQSSEIQSIQNMVNYAFSHRNLTMRSKISFERFAYQMNWLK